MARLLTVLAFLTFLTAPASAATKTLGFEELASGATLADQYKDTDGVRFGQGPSGASGTLPHISDAPADAQAGTKVANVDYTCHGIEFPSCDNTIWIAFATAKKTMKLYVGAHFAANGNPVPLTATYYSVTGAILGGSNRSLVPDTGYHTEIGFDRTDAQRVAFVELQAPTNQRTPIGFDELSFDVPDPAAPPPAPDFGLVWLSGGAGDVLGFQGTTRAADVRVTRVNGSAGDVNLAVKSTPPGVTATVSTDASDPDLRHIAIAIAKTAPAGSAQPLVLRATPPASAGAEAREVTIPVTVQDTLDLRATTLELSQAVQKSTVDLRSGEPYEGVPLVAGKRTVAKLYAYVASGPDAGLPGQAGLLYGTRDGKALPGSPLMADRGQRTLLPISFKNNVFVDRLIPGNAFEFTLPTSWTKGNVTLRGSVTPPGLNVITGLGGSPSPAYVPCQTKACLDDDSFTVTDVAFGDTIQWDVFPISLEYPRNGTTVKPAPIADAFDLAHTVSPLNNAKLQVPGSYSATIDIDKFANPTKADLDAAEKTYGKDGLGEGGNWRNDGVRGMVNTYIADHQATNKAIANANVVFGVNKRIGRGLDGGTGASVDGLAQHSTIADDFENRPSTLAHELFHGFGRQHAGPSCPGIGPPGTQTAVAWPPDEKGFMDGVGLDTRAAAPYDVIENGSPGHGAQTYDVMSYCRDVFNKTNDNWVSERAWRAIYDYLQPKPSGRSAPLATASATKLLRVAAVLTSTGAAVTDVGRITGAPVHGAGPYVLAARDSGGGEVERVPMAAEAADDSDSTFLTATVPASDRIASVAVLDAGGAVLAQRVRSAHRPTVKVLSPRRRQRVTGAAVTVRWKARDADGDPLDADVAYSADGGRHFHSVYLGRSRGRASLPGRYFARSRRARVRVTVSDGFDETSAVSGRFRAAGAPPTVQIIAPEAGLSANADVLVQLEGAAADDAGRAITGKRLQWFVGERRVARGATPAAYLSAGARTLTLVARDRAGRRARASVPIALAAVAPEVISYAGPASLTAKAKSLRFRAAVSLPARLTVTGATRRPQRFGVGRSARERTLRVTPGTTPLTLTLTFTAGGKTTVRTATITRG